MSLEPVEEEPVDDDVVVSVLADEAASALPPCGDPPGPCAKAVWKTFFSSVAWASVSLPDDTSFWIRSSIFDFTSAQRTRALFGGIYYEFSSSFGLRLDLTREWSTVDRSAVHAGFTTRF